MAKQKQATGQITFRCPVAVHEELLEIARILGLDVNGLLNQLVNEIRPSYLAKAKKLAAEQAQARMALDQTEIHAENPLVRQLVALGRKTSEKKRTQALIRFAVKNRKPDDPPVVPTVQFALELLKREKEAHEIQAAYEQMQRELIDLRDETRLDRLQD
jgi:hypothetical protein